MKKSAILLLTMTMLLCACTPAQNTQKPTAPTQAVSIPTTEATEPTTVPTEPEPTVPPTEATEPTIAPTEAPTQLPHSELYLPQYSQEQMLKFFNEVVLSVEYSDGTGDATLVQKWLDPIYYQYYGTPTEEDRAVLEALFAQLNAIPGFPGIYPVEYAYQENLKLHFQDKNAFDETFSHLINGENAYGATQFWYWTATNDIYRARIGYRTDIDQSTRNSILIEEIINTLGINDTVLRTDSIVYQYSNDNLALSDVDWVILKLLYDPAIQCGMNAEDCKEIILQRYH